MYIKSVDISNYHGIEKLHMNFREGINLLIGNNGAGKTSLLNALAVMLQESFGFLQGISSYFLNTNDAYQTTSIIGDVVVNTEKHFPISVESAIMWNQREYLCKQVKNNESANAQSFYFDLAHVLHDNTGDATFQYPMLCFLQARRGQLKIGELGSVRIPTGEPQRVQGYKDAFSATQNISSIQQWCFQMDFAEYQKKQKIKEYSAFQSIVSAFCAVMDEKADNPRIYYSSEKSTLVYNDGKDEKPLYLLSDGYQAALCIALELAYRAVILNPSMEELNKNLEGIVLIDEIEMHLHPAWQWKILDAFRQTFPKVQFIIATHSPVIISSASNAALYLMKSPNEVEELSSAYGYSIDDVLSLPQGTISQPEKIKAYYDRLEKIFDTGTEDDLNKLIAEIKEALKDSPAVLKGILDFVEVNKWVEEA